MAGTPLLMAPCGAVANNQFAFDLYAHLAEASPGENLCFSPFSITASLAMLHAGAAGETARQIADVLHVEPGKRVEPGRIQDAYGGAVELDAQPFQMANALWAHEDYPIRPAYAAVIRRDHAADIRTVDFARQPEPTRRIINDWVERKTKGRIPLLIDRPLPALTRLILTNAVHFLSKWSKPFDPQRTEREPFFVEPNRPIDVSMMRDETYVPYVEGDGYRAVALKYVDGPSMWIVLPDVNHSLAEVEASITIDALEAGWSSGARRDVILSLPRFHIRARCELRDALSALGMPSAFTESADFSGMHEPHPEPLVLSAVVHEAMTDVNEERTEAAAATATIMVGGSKGPSERLPPVEFRCDRPFLFLIRDAIPGAILFMGRLVDPTGE